MTLSKQELTAILAVNIVNLQAQLNKLVVNQDNTATLLAIDTSLLRIRELLVE